VVVGRRLVCWLVAMKRKPKKERSTGRALAGTHRNGGSIDFFVGGRMSVGLGLGPTKSLGIVPSELELPEHDRISVEFPL